jgi:hypothetical protein
MNTQENNKMIAEFMGLIIRDKDGNLPTSSQQYKLFVEEEWDKLYLASPYSPNGLDYHEYWDWLMPVVEKIESLGYEFFIVEDRVEVSHNTDHSIETIIDLTFGGSKIGATYQGVVEFINQYNKNK